MADCREKREKIVDKEIGTVHTERKADSSWIWYQNKMARMWRKWVRQIGGRDEVSSKRKAHVLLELELHVARPHR